MQSSPKTHIEVIYKKVVGCSGKIRRPQVLYCWCKGIAGKVHVSMNVYNMYIASDQAIPINNGLGALQGHVLQATQLLLATASLL